MAQLVEADVEAAFARASRLHAAAAHRSHASHGVGWLLPQHKTDHAAEVTDVETSAVRSVSCYGSSHHRPHGHHPTALILSRGWLAAATA